MLLYSTTGGMWTYPVRITYSFIPDGTSIGGSPSKLYATMPSGWQTAIEQAAAVWEAATGINFVQVPDDGAPIGSNGDQQGDPNFGDIRFGGMPQSSSVLAFAFFPPPFNGGTNAGDIFFNTAQLWQTNGSNYDLMSCAIHEIGHALGMEHSAIYSAVMYADYHGVAQSLTSDDTSGIQSIYGAAPGDSDNGQWNWLGVNGNGQGTATGHITNNNDVDWYYTQAPANTNGILTVSMQSSNLSSLCPSVYVYDTNWNYLGGANLSGVYGGTATATIGGVSPGNWYYIAAAPANQSQSTPGTTGNYGLLVNFCGQYQPPIPPPYTVVAAQPSQDPSTTPEGTGWTIGGKFIPYLGILDLSILNNIISLLGDGIFRIVYGSLSGYGDIMEVGDKVAHSHHLSKVAHGHHLNEGAGNTQLHKHHQHREDTLPGDASEATIIPLSVNTSADDNHGGPGTMFHLRNEAPRRVEAARLRAVDAVLSGWRPGGLLSARPPFDGRRPSGSRPTLSLSLRPEGDLITHAWPVKSLAKASP